MECLQSRPLECRVEVRVPLVAELDDVEEGLQHGLFLIVAAGSAECEIGLSIAQHDAWRERIPRTRARPQLGGASRIQPELLASCRQSDPRVADDHTA